MSWENGVPKYLEIGCKNNGKMVTESINDLLITYEILCFLENLM